MDHRVFQEYVNASQAIYEVWRTENDHEMIDGFEKDHVPEPYLNYGFRGLEESCVFLTTNPGQGMDHQLRAGIEELSGGALPREYLPLSVSLAEFYEGSPDLNGSARGNVRRMKEIARALGRPGVLQVELIPWHSASLPNKDRALSRLSEHELYADYYDALTRLIGVSPVVLSWSAGIPERRGGVGVEFKANAMKLDVASAELLKISSREGGVSQGLLWKREAGRLRGLFVTRGSANLPADRTLESGTTRYRSIAAAVSA
jgi:hypothetical protein